MLGVYVCDSLRGLWRLNYNLWGHLIISFVDAKEISSDLSLYRSVIHMQADRQTINMLSFTGGCVCSLDLITGLWHHPWDGRQAVNHLVAMIWDEGDRERRDEGQSCVSNLQGTITVTTEAHVRIKGGLFWWVSRETHPSHIHMSNTPNTPASISTESEEIPAKQHVKLRSFLVVLSLRESVRVLIVRTLNTQSKAVISASLLQSSVSHDPSEIILICWFDARETL